MSEPSTCLLGCPHEAVTDSGGRSAERMVVLGAGRGLGGLLRLGNTSPLVATVVPPF